MPNLPLVGPAVALVAGVIDHKEGAPLERLRALGTKAGEAIVGNSAAEFVVTQAFVAAALAEIAADALNVPVEEVLMAVLEAGIQNPG
jgi:hypothetical protein